MRRTFVATLTVVGFWVGLSAAGGCGGGGAATPNDGGGGGATDGEAERGGAAGGSAGSGGAAGSGGGGGGGADGAAGSGRDAASASDAAEAGDTTAPTAARTIGDIYCPTGATYPANPVTGAPQPTVVPIAPPGGIMFLEGPVWLADRGVLLLSEWNAGHRILQLTPPSTVEVFLPASRTNGLALTPDGKALLVVTEAPRATVSRVDLATKVVEPLVESYEGQAFVQPNDLAVRGDGVIYFTDYQAGRLYRRAVDGKVTAVSSLPHSNGVGLSPDEKTLYLNADARTVKYPVAADGTVGAGSDLTTGLKGADGLAIDCAGNVYVAQNEGGAVVVVSPAGAPLGTLGGLAKAVTNAAFGGPGRRTLYITTSSALYAVPLQIAGLPY